jgi:hypothetical protein
MVHKCIKCNKIIDSTKLYCRKCEAQIKRNEEFKKQREDVWNKADFFQRQRLK